MRGKYLISLSADVKGPGQDTILGGAELPLPLRRYLMLWEVIRAVEPPCSSTSDPIDHPQVRGSQTRFFRPSQLLLSRERSQHQEQVSPMDTLLRAARARLLVRLPQGDRGHRPAKGSAAPRELGGQGNEVTGVLGTMTHPERSRITEL